MGYLVQDDPKDNTIWYENVMTTLWEQLIQRGYAPPILPPNMQVIRKTGTIKNGKVVDVDAENYVTRTLGSITYAFKMHPTLGINTYKLSLNIYHDSILWYVRQLFRNDITKNAFMCIIIHTILHELMHYVKLYDVWVQSHADPAENNMIPEIPYEESVVMIEKFFSGGFGSEPDEAENESKTLDIMLDILGVGPSHPEYKRYDKHDIKIAKKIDQGEIITPDHMHYAWDGPYVNHFMRLHPDSDLKEILAMYRIYTTDYNARFVSENLTPLEIQEEQEEKTKAIRYIRKRAIDNPSRIIISDHLFDDELRFCTEDGEFDLEQYLYMKWRNENDAVH